MKIYQVKEACKLTGLTRKQLFDYRNFIEPINKPASNRKTEYKLYDEKGLEALKKASVLRKLELPVKEIREIIQNPECDLDAVLGSHIEKLKRRNNKLEQRIFMAEWIREYGLDHIGEYAIVVGEMLQAESLNENEMIVYLEQMRQKQSYECDADHH